MVMPGIVPDIHDFDTYEQERAFREDQLCRAQEKRDADNEERWIEEYREEQAKLG